MLRKLKWAMSILVGKIRLLHGFCPMCNSDAPELYDCPVCNYYSSAGGDKWPPSKSTKSNWWNKYKGAVNGKLMVRELIEQHKQN